MKKVVLLGAGAIGAYIIWGFSKARDIDFCILAEGHRKERLKREGLKINGETYFFPVKSAKEIGEADLLICAVKTTSLTEALPLIKAVSGKETVIMSLLNGVESEKVIAQAVGEEHVLTSLIRIAAQRQGAEVNFPMPFGRMGIIYGEIDGKRSRKMEIVEEIFSKTELLSYQSNDIQKELWSKFALNISCNLPQAMLNCGLGANVDSRHVYSLGKKLWQEVVLLAKAQGIFLKEEGFDELLPVIETMKTARYSTLQDLDAKRKTEIEAFSGAVLRMGKQYGIETPYNEFAYHVISALEEKAEGKIK